MPTDDSHIAFAVELNAFADYLRSQHSDSARTREAYLGDTRDFLRWVGEQNIHELTALCATDLTRWQTETISHLKAASQRRKIASLRVFFRLARRQKWCAEDPTELLTPPRADHTLPDFLTEHESLNLIHQIEVADALGARDRALVILLYATGIRRAEAAGTNWPDLDAHRRLLKVSGKGNKQRIVPVAQLAVDMLYNYRDRWQAEERPVQDTEAVFLNNRGERLSLRSLNSAVNRFRQRSGAASTLHPHMLRHSYASQMLSRGADLRMLQEALGHASLSTTQQYTHLDLQALRNVYDKTHPHAKKK